MAGFWVFMLNFCLIYTTQARRNYSHPITEREVHQSDTVLCVETGDSVTLQCCIYGTQSAVVIWYKQPNRKQPRIISKTVDGEETFYNEFQNPRFQVNRSSNCSNMTISNITQSDEATYYCANISPYSVFGNGTYLKIKGTSEQGLCENSFVCEATLNEFSTNNRTQEKAVLGLGSALCLCVLLIFCLTYFLLRRRKSDQMHVSIEDSPGLMQEAEDEKLNYAALKFSKRKDKAENSGTVSSSECVYSTVKHNYNK